MSNTTTIRRNKNSQNRSFRNFMWISMLMSLAVVFFGMQLMMVGPLKGRLDAIQTRLDAADQNMELLVGVSNDVNKTNNLLADIEAQAAKLETVQQAIAGIADLHQAVESEAKSSTLALSSLDRISTVQKRIIASRQQTDTAIQQIAELESLRDEVMSGGSQTEIADNSLDGMVALQKRVIAASNNYEKASDSIASMADLTDRLANSNEDLKVAASRFDDFIGLQNRMIASVDQFEAATEGVDKALESSSALAKLKNDILAGGENAEVAQQNAETLVSINGILSASENVSEAQENARTLVAMNESLNGENIQLDSAGRNLSGLLSLQAELTEQSGRVTAAIENLEVLDDLNNEVSGHVRSLAGLRRSLIEIAMMETTVGKIAHIMTPLTDLSSLRRLSQTEVRQAAQVILDARSTRLSHSSTPIKEAIETDSGTGDAEDSDLVPLPPEARELQ